MILEFGKLRGPFLKYSHQYRMNAVHMTGVGHHIMAGEGGFVAIDIAVLCFYTVLSM